MCVKFAGYSGERRFFSSFYFCSYMVFVQICCRGVKEQRRHNDARKDCTELFYFDSVDDGLSEKQVG
jgi:hypothetical protein